MHIPRGRRPRALALALVLFAAGPAAAEAYQVTVKLHGAGEVVETTARGLMHCSVDVAGRSESSMFPCVAGTPGGLYAFGDVVRLEARVPATPHEARGWRFEKWVEGDGGGQINCDPQGAPADHTATACQFQIFEDLEIDLYFVDVKDPTTTITSAPTSRSPSTTATFGFTSDDPDARYECLLDAGLWHPCGGPADTSQTYTGLSNRAHTFFVRARDLSGNVDSSPATFTWTVDTVAPIVTIAGGPAPGSTTSDTTATFTVTSSEPGLITCSLDDDARVPCNGPLTGLADGEHIFRAQTADAAGNISAPRDRTWTVDTVAPDTAITTGRADGSMTAEDGAVFVFASPDATASFECSLNNAAFMPCTSPKTYSALPDGTYRFAVRALDTAGNADRSPASRTWTVDTTPPPPPPPPPGPPPAPPFVPPFVPPPAPPPPPPGVLGSSSSAAEKHPAKLKVRRAGLKDGKLDVLAELTNHANGDEVEMEFEAAGTTFEFTEKVEDGLLRFRKALPRGQRGVRSGIITYRYAGNAEVRSAEVRLRAANRRADLKRSELTLEDGRLTVGGTISDAARGVVRLELDHRLPDGTYATWKGKAPIDDGRWRLAETLPAAARAGGYLTIQFTGYRPRGMRGEQDAKQIGG